MVEHRHPAGEVVGLVVGGRSGADKADVPGDGSQDAEQRERFELHHGAQRAGRLRAEAVILDRVAVGEEEDVEAAPFRRAGERQVHLQV